tara:strand:- start:859 stop:1797 length:939 start_codon:yes stop_codon:yes gene_type:complete
MSIFPKLVIDKILKYDRKTKLSILSNNNDLSLDEVFPEYIMDKVRNYRNKVDVIYYFLEIFKNWFDDDELRSYMLWMITMIYKEKLKKRVFIMNGTGCNGRSQFLNLLKTLLGDEYVSVAGQGILNADPLLRRGIIDKKVIYSNDGIDKGLVYTILSNDKIVCRELYKSPKEFVPEFNYFCVNNNSRIIETGNIHEAIRFVRCAFDKTKNHAIPIPFKIRFVTDKNKKLKENEKYSDLKNLLYSLYNKDDVYVYKIREYLELCYKCYESMIYEDCMNLYKKYDKLPKLVREAFEDAIEAYKKDYQNHPDLLD